MNDKNKQTINAKNSARFFYMANTIIQDALTTKCARSEILYTYTYNFKDTQKYCHQYESSFERMQVPEARKEQI